MRRIAYNRVNMASTYHITTFGCQMNDYDSQLMEGILAARGMTRAADEGSADVILYNTCVVRESAEERAMNRLSQLAALKKSTRRGNGDGAGSARRGQGDLRNHLPIIGVT